MPEEKMKSLKETLRQHGEKRQKPKPAIFLKNYLWIIPSLFLLIAVVLLAYRNQELSNRLQKETARNLNTSQAVSLMNNFVHKAYGNHIKEFKILDAKKSHGLYAMRTLIVSLNGQKATSTLYLSPDGYFLIPQPINIVKVEKILAERKKMAAAQAGKQEAPKNIPKAKKPKVEIFTMAFCPFGNQAEEGLYPVTKLLKKYVAIVPHYVIYQHYQGGSNQYCVDNGKYCSMHGVNEVKQDVRELCVYKYYPQKYWDYVYNIDRECNVGDINTCWQGPAKKLGISLNKIEKCAKDEGLKLLANEVALDKKYNVVGSPTLIINGVQYEGGRAPENYKTAICNAFEKAPSVCQQKLGTEGANASGGCR